MKEVKIGDKKLSSITKEDVLRIAIIEGCCPCFDYWNEPTALDFDNIMFSDCVVLDYQSIRKEDNWKSSIFVFFFHHKDISYHYHRDRLSEERMTSWNRLKIESIKYLISQGYDIPIY